MLIDGIGTRQANDQFGVVCRQDLALAPLEALVARRQDERGPACAAVEHEVRTRGLDPTEVVELVGLARERKASRQRSALHDRHGLVTDAVEDRGPARLELLGREVLLVVG